MGASRATLKLSAEMDSFIRRTSSLRSMSGFVSSVRTLRYPHSIFDSYIKLRADWLIYMMRALSTAIFMAYVSSRTIFPVSESFIREISLWMMPARHG